MATQVQWTAGGPMNTLGFRVVQVTLDNNYPTGGYALSSTQLGVSTVFGVMVMSNPSGYVFEWSGATGKLKAYRENGAGAYTQNVALSEVANAASTLNGITVTLLVVGQ